MLLSCWLLLHTTNYPTIVCCSAAGCCRHTPPMPMRLHVGSVFRCCFSRWLLQVYLLLKPLLEHGPLLPASQRWLCRCMLALSLSDAAWSGARVWFLGLVTLMGECPLIWGLTMIYSYLPDLSSYQLNLSLLVLTRLCDVSIAPSAGDEMHRSRPLLDGVMFLL